MQKIKILVAASVAAVSMFAGAGVAQANPVRDEVCENFPGPRDGKAWWYTALCR